MVVVYEGQLPLRVGPDPGMTRPIPPASTPRDPTDAFVGTVVNGKFEILSQVAVGGMGRIYRARQLPLDRIVALKVLHSQYTHDTPADTFQRRFSREATILSHIQHANVVTVFDFGVIEGRHPETYYMAMEYLDGRTLLDRLLDEGAMPVGEVFSVIRQVARGLRGAHKQGLVHRDLKPSNIMLVPEDGGGETAKILDFGLVKVLSDDSEQVTKEGNLLGSPRYMAPEQIMHGAVDARTDIYALGVIMFQCLCGVVPYESDQAVQTLMAHLNDPIPGMKTRNPSCDVPEVVERLVQRCLAKDPASRPASVGELVRQIVACERALGWIPGPTLGGDMESGSMSRPRALPSPDDSQTMAEPSSMRRRLGSSPAATAPGATASPDPGRKPWLLAIVAAAGVLAAVGIAGAVLWHRSEPPPPAAAVSSPHADEQFVMWIDSIPTGADVYEGDSKIGSTPIQMTFGNAALRERPRSLALKKDGYQTYSIVQGPSPENVRVTASLLAVSGEDASLAGPSAVPSAAPETTRARPVPTPHPPATGDIRLTR